MAEMLRNLTQEDFQLVMELVEQLPAPLNEDPQIDG
ncbi:MAG: hypothetical protein JG773_1060, partial [Spirochaeta sp.]|nr:hypothetical protein [Spirochaeta sp.]